MTITKQSAFKRGLAAVLALAMVFSIGLFQTFSFQVNAASLRASGTPVRQLDVPVEDGVYYADIELMNATDGRVSMGNTALRGSSSYEAKQTGDTAYRPLIVVKDGKATAILEYMPMGYLSLTDFFWNSILSTQRFSTCRRLLKTVPLPRRLSLRSIEPQRVRLFSTSLMIRIPIMQSTAVTLLTIPAPPASGMMRS